MLWIYAKLCKGPAELSGLQREGALDTVGDTRDLTGFFARL